ncbi:MAG: phosphoribosylamine--glycine ligase [Verrucomicrobia bacterium]|nr:phosphoribosylamine--glycine ligase [Verrucomicrobiota bacterium]MDA1088409.1 phosphoribosylamine--glycine ligase [Verrucomicrobiota bacterium]
MKILVIGGGGREDVLAWKLARDSARPELFCAPGNAGTRRYGTNLDIGAEDMDALLAWARVHRPDLTVVGPEAPLCAGVVDQFEAEGLRVFGPSQAGAELEGSKVFSKEVMSAAGVPTAAAEYFTSAAEAKAYLDQTGVPVVIKAEGLAAGKGVTVCETREQAESAIDESLVGRAFGDAGNRILVEAFLDGEEASILALVDGTRFVLLASSQDHKRALDDDQGPNTGGMGAYSPAPIIADEMWPLIRDTVFQPLLDELTRRGISYKGVLYAGLMVGESGIKVLEFNCRFGDPEAQVVIPRISSDLVPVLNACIDGALSDDLVTWHDDVAVGVVMASGGYPGSYQKGKVIEGLDDAGSLDGVVVFHAGTAVRDGDVVTSGGRVLCVTARGRDLEQAVAQAYKAIEKIGFDGAHYRRDIAAKAFRCVRST